MARAKHYPLPKRFSAALSERAYARLRALNGEYSLGNNYLITVLLENLDEIAAPGRPCQQRGRMRAVLILLGRMLAKDCLAYKRSVRL